MGLARGGIRARDSWGITGPMAVFLSTYVNKVDRKGRVSIPAQFRQSLAKTSAASIVYLWPSLNHQALEGADQDYLDVLSESLESLILTPMSAT